MKLDEATNQPDLHAERIDPHVGGVRTIVLYLVGFALTLLMEWFRQPSTFF